MKLSKSLLSLVFLCMVSFLYSSTNEVTQKQEAKKKLVYLVSDIQIPFWNIMSRGIKSRTDVLGYDFEVYSAKNSSKKELELTINAIENKVAGIIVSPTNSSACVTVLKLAKSANIPVVIADVGSDSDEYVSYISSNNEEGAYNVGKVLSQKMMEFGWQNGRVGMIAIPQKRLNGQARTAGFMTAMDESNIKGADLKQLVTWSQEETYDYVKEMISKYPNLRAVWLQTSSIYSAALKAIEDAGKKENILLIAFDAEPEFLDLISKGDIIGSGMQQPYLMGQKSVEAMHRYLIGKKVNKSIQVPILIVSMKNINEKLPEINLNVLGIETK